MSLKFRISPYDTALLIHDFRKIYMTIHVDDVRMTGPIPENLDWCQAEIAKRFEIKDVGESGHYLDIKIDQTEKEIKLSQSQYIKDLLKEFGMENCHPVSTPLDPGIEITINDNLNPEYTDKFTKHSYQSDVESVQFLASQTRTDIAQAAGFLARFNNKPNYQCWQAFKHLLRYLKGSIDLGMLFCRDGSIESRAYGDAD